VKAAGVVELVDVRMAVEAARGHKKHGKEFAKTVASGKRVMTEAEKKAKEKEAFDQKVSTRAKLCLMEYLRDRAAEKGMDREAALAVLETVLMEAGKDGCQLMAEVLGIAPREKKANEYGVNAEAYREPILEALRAQDAGKPELDRLIMLGVISKYVKAWGISFGSLKPLQDHFGFDARTITTLATAEVRAEMEAKAAKKTPEKAGKAAKNSTDPTDFSVDAEVSKTKAADQRARGKSAKVKEMEETAPAKVRKINDYRCDGCGCELSVPFGKGDEAASLPKGEMNCVACGGKWQKPTLSLEEEILVKVPVGGLLQHVYLSQNKLGKATGWTPIEVEAGAELLKAKSHDVTTLIGPKPDRKKDAINYKNWNGLRMRMLRKAGLAK
jgi:hypothetical protein